jgi:hypothetical protein
MAISDSRSTGDGKDASLGRVAHTVDHVLACYINWREDAATVRDAYARWSAAPPDADETGLFSAYLAALDREQSAAASYALGMARLDALSRPRSTS